MSNPGVIDKRSDDDFVPRAPETFTSAHELYKEMRARCPLAHSNEWGGFWVLSRYEDVVGVLKDYHTYTTSVQNVVPKVAFTGRRPPLHLDPPEHSVYRRLINRFFTKEKMARIEPLVQRDTEELAKALIGGHTVEIAADYSHKIPAHVFAHFFNLPVELSAKIKEISTAYVKAIMEFDDQEKVKRLSLGLYDIAREVIAERRRKPMSPDDDLTSALLAETYEGQPLPDDMILGCVRALLVAGMIAPSVLIASIFVHMTEHPDIQEQLRSDLSLIPAAVEEYLRLLTPYRGMSRTAKHDVVIHGQLIRKDEPIALNYASANRDDSVFPDGDRFILNRPNIDRHIVFGEGPHKCPAGPLARMMVRYSIEEALKRTTRIERAGEIKMTVWAEWGVLSAPMKLFP
ncbi:cytochrome P450 [Cohnella caldifontis]|uniref:cytochrome P450 n=1 Tax=Cohnella caldifontis TaxID=3027471 RepID=UPI0023EBB49F|nr:cytochrome P450 [Cohnella sp. YIM B05605]